MFVYGTTIVPGMHLFLRCKSTATNAFLRGSKYMEITREQFWTIWRMCKASQLNICGVVLASWVICGRTLPCNEMMQSINIPGRLVLFACFNFCKISPHCCPLIMAPCSRKFNEQRPISIKEKGYDEKGYGERESFCFHCWL